MDDLISRQDAIDALEWKWAGKAAIDAIKNLPSAQPERKKGKWIQPVPRRNVLAYSRAYSECDQCHEVIYLGNEMKYCPNCGADMRGEEE